LNIDNDDNKGSSNISELESFILSDNGDMNTKKEDEVDAESLFKKPPTDK